MAYFILCCKSRFSSNIKQESIVSETNFMYYPVFQTKKSGDTTVEFLDWNLMALYCLLFNNPDQLETVYNKCFFLTQYE